LWLESKNGFFPRKQLFFIASNNKDFYLKYLEESGWYKLPLANKFGARKFIRTEEDNFFAINLKIF